MLTAPIPQDEQKRLEALQQLGILDTKPEERFDVITREACQRLHVPISTVSIIDKDREWFKSCQGLGITEGDRATSFCGHALLAKYLFVVEDASKDPRFADNPKVFVGNGIRFYAGMALRERSSGQPIGVLCVKDFTPRKMSSDEVAILLDLAREAEDELNKGTVLNAKCLEDIAEIQKALKLYYAEQKKYPVADPAITLGDEQHKCLASISGFAPTSIGTVYMEQVRGDSVSEGSNYRYRSVDGSTYTIAFYLKASSDGLARGLHMATPHDIE